jgi:small GTP-binding protein
MIVRKLMLLGDMAVGKTSIANRLAFDRFGESYKSTIGTDIYVYDVDPPPGGKPFQFLIWDTDGNFEDAMFRSHYMRGAHAAIIVGDLTRRATLESQLRLAQKFSEALPGRYFAAVLNKNDLTDQFPPEDDWLPDGLREPYFPLLRTSAKSGLNIQRTFEEAAQTIVRRHL